MMNYAINKSSGKYFSVNRLCNDKARTISRLISSRSNTIPQINKHFLIMKSKRSIAVTATLLFNTVLVSFQDRRKGYAIDYR